MNTNYPYDLVARAKWCKEHDAPDPLLSEVMENAAIAFAEQHEFPNHATEEDRNNWINNWIDKWFQENAEPPAALLYRVLCEVYDNTDSFDFNNIGSELTYLARAIASPHAGPDQSVLWDMHSDPTRYVDILELFSSLFEPHDPVWNHIVVRQSHEDIEEENLDLPTHILCQVVWDFDGEDDPPADVPTTVLVKLSDVGGVVQDIDDMPIADYLSDKFGWCVKSFTYEVQDIDDMLIADYLSDKFGWCVKSFTYEESEGPINQPDSQNQ